MPKKFSIMFKTTIMSDISSKEAMELENSYGAHNYKPIPVVIARGEGVHVFDPEGKHYYDFLSAYSALNHGHCHPRIVNAFTEQAKVLTLTSRAFYNNLLGECEKYLCDYFGYEKALMMNSGAEGVETALKLARKWGYEVKGIKDNKAIIIVVEGNFHGRTTGIISFSNDPESRKNFGPFIPGYKIIPYNNTKALKDALKDKNVCAFMVEPIQGEAGVVVPDEKYISDCFKLCKQNNVLFIADEIQTGLGRTGKMLCCDYSAVKPDILILGKALSGGVMPVSSVLSSDEIMLTIKPGEHGSTYGGNPLACRLTMTSLQILKDEKLVENSFRMGTIFRKRMNAIKSPLIKLVRGKGLFNAVVIAENPKKITGWDVCVALKENGLLAKPTHESNIRFAPPLIIREEELHECCDIIERVFSKL